MCSFKTNYFFSFFDASSMQVDNKITQFYKTKAVGLEDAVKVVFKMLSRLADTFLVALISGRTLDENILLTKQNKLNETSPDEPVC